MKYYLPLVPIFLGIILFAIGLANIQYHTVAMTVGGGLILAGVLWAGINALISIERQR